MDGESDFAKKVILEIDTRRAQAIRKELLEAQIRQAYPGSRIDLTKFDFGPDRRYAPKRKLEIFCLFLAGDIYYETGIWQMFSLFQASGLVP